MRRLLNRWWMYGTVLLMVVVLWSIGTSMFRGSVVHAAPQYPVVLECVGIGELPSGTYFAVMRDTRTGAEYLQARRGSSVAICQMVPAKGGAK